MMQIARIAALLLASVWPALAQVPTTTRPSLVDMMLGNCGAERAIIGAGTFPPQCGNVAITNPASLARLSLSAGKTFAVSNTMTQTATDGAVAAFGAGGTVLYASSTIPLTVGGSTISGGTSGRVLYDNAGVVGEYTAAQLTAQINSATSALSGALPAWPSNTTTFFRGDGTYAAVAVSGLSGLGTGVATALGTSVGTAGSFVVNGGAGGTPASLVLTNATLLPNAGLLNSSVTVNGTAISLGASGTVTAAAGTLTGATLNSTVTASSLTSLGTIASLTATTINGLTITTSTGTLTVPNGVVLSGPAASGTAMTLGNTEAVTGQKTFSSARFANNSFLALLDSVGNAGTGLTNDASNILKLVQANNSEASVRIGFSSNAANMFTIYMAGAEVYRVSGSGGVGVNTTSDPGAGLIYLNSASFLMRNKTSWSNGAAGSNGTLTNAPAAGNPTKWIPVDDNGTTRYVPSW